eukprot:SAG31_NODE_3578_length_4103_cov_1.960789_4_plen_89_part_00
MIIPRTVVDYPAMLIAVYPGQLVHLMAKSQVWCRMASEIAYRRSCMRTPGGDQNVSVICVSLYPGLHFWLTEVVRRRFRRIRIREAPA